VGSNNRDESGNTESESARLREHCARHPKNSQPVRLASSAQPWQIRIPPCILVNSHHSYFTVGNNPKLQATKSLLTNVVNMFKLYNIEYEVPPRWKLEKP
jgi:hypothetical protein